MDDGRWTIADLPDAEARTRAVDPAYNVVLEASAGTGKTHVLVDRYLNLLSHGVDPGNILAITFTRKAAAEMRGRILHELSRRAGSAGADQRVWRDLRERSGDVAISTIDAFCLSLLREFPLEANLDPGFDTADQTQVLRLMEEALDRALDVSRGLSRSDADVRLLFAELREHRLRDALATMLDRRLIVGDVLDRAFESGPGDLTAERACEQAFERLRRVFNGLTGGVGAFVVNGPVHHRRWALLAADLRMIADGVVPAPGLARGILDRVEAHFLNKDGEPRQRFDRYSAKDCASVDAWRIHRRDVGAVGRDVGTALKGFRRDLNVVLSRGVRRAYRIALDAYRESLDSHGLLDFPEILSSALMLLEQMEEFARSRYRLEGRYHHVLLDEFQDTSRAQWTLVALLIRSWGEGRGIAEGAPLNPSIFLVGDRKQSIYGFRDADVAVMDEAAAFVDQLRAEQDSRRAISKSFRAAPPILAFANDLFHEIEKVEGRRDAFRFGEQDRFPVESPIRSADSLGLVAAPTVIECADAVAAEIRRLIDSKEPIADSQTGQQRSVTPRDIAVLFRTKDNHRDFEKALERQLIPAYVYKGLGFFEADEIKDVLALLRYLAAPDSNLRAAAFLRSRFVRLSDAALQTLGPRLAAALCGSHPGLAALGTEDRVVLEHTRRSMVRWLDLVDRLPPAEILDMVLQETAYLVETRGPRVRQARENLKKIRAMVRRVQNSGYATLSRVAEHFDRLSEGDESNAVIDAGDSVSLMTIHAAKGLEFPVAFVVNLTRGTGGRRSAIRVVSEPTSGQGWLSVGDFQSEADEDAKAKDREETKRLLYVAVTRARDRLYLVSEVKEGRFRAFGGSLGDVLPSSLRAVFEVASLSPAPAATDWAAVSGQTHRLRVCPAPKIGSNPIFLPEAAESSRQLRSDPLDNFGPMVDPFALPRLAVTASAAVTQVENVYGSTAESRTSALAGTLVHRLFEHFGAGLANGAEESAISGALARLLRHDEAAEAGETQTLMNQARHAYLALCAEPGLANALETGDALFEVPFSVRLAGSQTIFRGSFDCLIRQPDGSLSVLELKTGRPVPQHEQQLAMYLAAARALYPGTVVEGRIVYAGEPHLDHRPLHPKH